MDLAKIFPVKYKKYYIFILAFDINELNSAGTYRFAFTTPDGTINLIDYNSNPGQTLFFNTYSINIIPYIKS